MRARANGSKLLVVARNIYNPSKRKLIARVAFTAATLGAESLELAAQRARAGTPGRVQAATPSKFYNLALKNGDVLIVETGGGGYGVRTCVRRPLSSATVATATSCANRRPRRHEKFPRRWHGWHRRIAPLNVARVVRER